MRWTRNDVVVVATAHAFVGRWDHALELLGAARMPGWRVLAELVWLAGEALRGGDRDPLERLLKTSKRNDFGTLDYVVGLCIELERPELAWEFRAHFAGLSLRAAEDRILEAVAEQQGARRSRPTCSPCWMNTRPRCGPLVGR